MAQKEGGPYPHEKRVLRLAYGSAIAAIVLAAQQVLTTDPILLGFEPPLFALLGVLLAGAILAFVAIARRSTALVFAAGALLILAVLPAGAARPGIFAYLVGILFGLALLLTGELVHMTERYERAHRAVDAENVPEEHIDRVMDEALRTLAIRGGFAALAVAGAVGVAFLLQAVGPAQWRAAIETSAPLGVAVAALALAGAASLFVLARGAAFRREPRPKEMLPDVAE